VRVAFVGERTAFGACVPSGAPFVDHRRGADPDALARRLAELAPRAVVVFRPEIVPAGLLDDIDAATLGLVVDPLPRELPEADLGQFDRLATRKANTMRVTLPDGSSPMEYGLGK